MAENSLLEKLEVLKLKFEEVEQQITDPAIIADQKRFIQLNKEYKELQGLVEAYKTYKNTIDNIASAKQMLEEEDDAEMKEMAKAELDELQSSLPVLEEEIKMLLIPKDPQDDKNAILEIRAGTGGDEASLFAGELYRMYAKYCEKKGWRISMTSCSEGTQGGYKEIICSVSGEGVYGVKV